MGRVRVVAAAPRRALAGVALAALLALAPVAALAGAQEGVGEEVVQEVAAEATELAGADNPSDADAAAELAGADALSGAAAAPDTAVPATDSTSNEAAAAADEDASPLPDATAAETPVDIADAAVREDAGAASDDPVAQVQALGIATDPSQVEGYDPAADEEPAQDADAPTGYDASAAASDGGISAQSDSSVRVGDWSYRADEVDGQTVYVIDGYYGSASSVTLPATIGGKQMYSVSFWYGGLPSTVTSVTIPASIKEIGASAFYGTKVTSITFAANSQLTTIGEQAFAQTPLTEFTIPAHVKTLGNKAFYNSLLTKLTLNTELEPMVYVGTVVSGSNTYERTEHYNPCGGCSRVTFVVPSGCKNYRVENGALLSRDGTILYAQMSDVGGGAYTVPDGVQIIGSYAMCNNTTFSDIVLPQGLTTMELYCLYRTSIHSLSMPDSVTHVQGYICESCAKLTSVRISNNLEELGECAGWECFYGCYNLTSLTLGSKLRLIGNACFAGSKLTSVNLPASLEQINYGAFGNISTLTSVTGGSGLRYIYNLAFRNAGITSFTFGKNLKFVSNTAFYNCKFTPSYPSYMDKQSDGYYVYDGYLAVRGDKSYTLAYQVLDLVNEERAKQGLSALTMDKELLDVAMQRAAETSICWDHDRPTGQECFTASSKMTAENIASGLYTAQAVMDQWMNSEGHRANILDSNAKSIGIGCVKVTGRYLWVQCFSTSEATGVSKPADASDVVMKVPYTTSGLTAFGSKFEVYPVDSDGVRVVSTSGALQAGSSQRYALFTYPWGSSSRAITLIDNSCVDWSFSGKGAEFNGSNVTVTGTGTGSFTLTASVGDGTLKRSVSRDTQAVTYTVSFNTNGGSGVASQGVTSGGKASKPTNPTKTGYTFKGWYSDAALSKAYDFNAAVTGNLTLYAKWDANSYTVTFNTNGGSAVTAQSVKYGAKATKPGDPTKSGYTFKGWYSDKNLSKAYDFNAAVTGNLTLYAKWDANSYTVTFNTNGGSAVTAQSVKYGAKATRPVDPTRYCYAFTGWYTTATCTAKFDFNTAVKGNVTVYAGWKPAAPTWFWDVDYSDWYGDWATYAATNGLMTGLKDDAGNYTGAFSPSASLTRAMVATVLWRAAGSPSASSAGFPDVKSGAWYADAVNWCARVGIVTGYTGGADQGYFRPDRAVSREELATMVWRFAKHEGVNVANPSTSNFYATTDWRSVSAYAVEPLKWTSAVGLMAGVDYHNGTYGLEPQGTATRAQAAKVFSVLHRDVLTGKVSAHALDEGDVDAGEAAGQAAETAEQQAVPTVTTGVTQEGLAYAIVPEGALDASGAAFELDAEYDELGGRYVGPGAYVTGYAGEKTLLTLPLELGGVPVVSANLSWGEDGGAAQGADVLGADARGNTRLTGVVLQKGCKLVQLDISGNALTGLDLLVLPDEGGLAALRFLDASNSLLTALDVSACPALERLNVSGNRITDAAALSAWVGATGLVADVSGQVVDAAQVPADVPSADEADAPAADQLAADEAGQPEGSELAEDQPAADEPGNPTADVPAADVPAADGSVIGEPAGATTEGAAFAAAVADDAPAPAEAPAA